MHLNAGPERDLEPKPTCIDCGQEVVLLPVADICIDCYETAKADYEGVE